MDFGYMRLKTKETKRTTDSLKHMDIRWLRLQGYLVPGTLIYLPLTKKGESMSCVGLRVEENRVILGNLLNSIRIFWIRCNYGGKRPWFICPGYNGRSCGRRVAILYCNGLYFRCRHCFDLTYQSRNESRFDRSLRKARKVRTRLGASRDLFEPIIAKPKGMHWETFETLDMEARMTTIRAFNFQFAAIEEKQKEKEKKTFLEIKKWLDEHGLDETALKIKLPL